jgi:pilus assembly protein CpaE
MSVTSSRGWTDSNLDKDDGFQLEDDPTFAQGAIEEPPFPAELVDPPAPTGWSAAEPIIHAAADQSRGGDQPVPRITILAFTERPEIGKLIGSVAADRRLAKAVITTTPGGVDTALTALATQSSPNLIILDTQANAQQLLHGLDRLAQVVDEGTKVIVIGAANDIGLYRELIRRGVSEYLVPPLQPVQVIQSISSLYVNPDKPFVGRVAAVVGAKGGVGASTIAHNLAWSIAERYGANTTLMDLDLSFGTVGLDYNQDQTQGVVDALLSPDRVDDVFLDRLLTRQTERLTLFTAPATLDREFEFDAAAYEIVVDRVRRTVPYVILDLPHVWSGWLKHTLLSADDVVIVTTPDLAGLRNCKNMLDLVRGARPHDSAPTVVLNTVGIPKRPEIPTKDFGEALGMAPSVLIPFEPILFGTAANNGQMVVDLAPESKPGAALDQLASALCGREPAPKKRTSLFDRLPILKR